MTTKLIKGVQSVQNRVLKKVDGDYIYTFKSKSTKNEYPFTVADLSPQINMATFSIDSTDIPEGEYLYTIVASDGSEVRRGIAYCRGENPAQVVYTTNEKIKVYE